MAEGTPDPQSDAKPVPSEAEALEDADLADRGAATVASTTPTGANFSTLPESSEYQIIAARYEGLLPHPSILQGYDEVVPGAAKEIISWVTQETKHRRNLESTETRHRRELEKREFEHRKQLETKSMQLGERALEAGIFRANVGMLLAWPLVIGIVGVGTFLIYTGHDVAGTILAESGLAIVVGAFVLQKIERSKRNERRGKDEDARDPVDANGGE